LTKTLESAHEPAGSKDRAAALLHRTRPRHSGRVAGPVDDSGDSSCPGPADWLCRGLVSRRRGLFTFVTGLTIGYGDIVPQQALTRALAIGIGISGLFLTGLIAGIAVYAMRTTLVDRNTD
jgi:hypothetical protein